MEEGTKLPIDQLNKTQKTAIDILTKFNTQNKHKMISIPTFKL